MNDHKKTKNDLKTKLQDSSVAGHNPESKSKNHSNNGMHPEMMLQKMIAHSPISIQMLNKDGFSVSVNDAHTEFFGVIPPADYNLFHDPLLLKQGMGDHFNRLRQGEAVFFPDTWYNAHLLDRNFPDKTVWLKSCGISVPDSDGLPQFFIIMHENITERVQYEKELKVTNEKLHLMAKHLEMSIEKEREYFSGELHDLVGQSLTGLKMDIDAILMTRPKDECSMKFKEVVTRLNDLIKTVQNITATVRPMMLRGKGLKQNIEWYISEFERRSKMEVFENIDYSVDLPQDVVICVIRILQESLTNIIRHSKATQVGIMIKRSGDWLHMTVSDNGVGITDEQKNSQDSSGIIIMNERVSTLGGRFHITTEDKLGTKINIQFPLKQQKL